MTRTPAKFLFATVLVIVTLPSAYAAFESEERRPLALPSALERAPIPLPDLRGRERFLPSDTRERERTRAIVQQGKWSGYIATEGRLFLNDALFPEQKSTQLSLSIQPEYYQKWDNGKQSFTFVPFYRYDATDGDRTHFDIRELTWLKVGKGYEWRMGIRKVFWGVTESQHLVDIINQTDAVENPDGEEKLGQPMFNLALMSDWGTVDIFVLPGFRERTFPGPQGRLRLPVRVDSGDALYESDSKWRHVDFAARWSRTSGDWDIGLSHFAGTNREPSYQVGIDSAGQLVLTPYYGLINQTGLDVLVAKGSWLWKLEAIYRSGRQIDKTSDNYFASTAGFEYTFPSVFGSGMDFSVLSEYLYDDRGTQATTPFQNDIMFGMRLAANDVQSTELLAGVIFDPEKNTHFISVEGSRRIGDNWKLNMEGRAYNGLKPADLLYGIRNDSYLQLEVARYF